LLVEVVPPDDEPVFGDAAAGLLPALAFADDVLPVASMDGGFRIIMTVSPSLVFAWIK
jgi:hypothetical protein